MKLSDKARPFGGLTVLIVDDEDLVREVAAMIVQENGGIALQAGDFEDALEVLKGNPDIDCAVVDYSMPGGNGYDLFVRIEADYPGMPFVMVSGLMPVEEVIKLERAGRLVFIGKPFGEAGLVHAVQRAVQMQQLA
jgi:DNA-binding NtrC family response regulator